MVIEAQVMPPDRLADLINELDQLVAMTVASQKTLRSRNPKSKIQNRK